MVILSANGVEQFEWPTWHPPNATAPVLLTAATIAFIVNALSMIGQIIASPLFMSVGLGLTIPASFIADRIVHSERHLSALAICGALLVTVAFLLMHGAEWLHAQFDRKARFIWIHPRNENQIKK